MNIDWINKDESTGAVTIYENNITLNKKAADFFVDAYAVAVGVNREKNQIVIKNISKEEAQNINKSSLRRISLKSSYGRITGKKLIDELKESISFDFKQKNAYKFGARWHTGNRMLIIDTKEEK